MGLDMYLSGNKYLRKDYQNPQNDATEDGYPLKERVVELGYWRKHPNLHGFIVHHFGDGVDNCQEIDLSLEALEKLMEVVQQPALLLPHTEGFFFGESVNDAEQIKDDVGIIRGAIKWLKQEGAGEIRSVIYRASW